MQISPPFPLVRVGDSVRVRRQRWLVADIRDYGPCRLLTLTGSGALNGGERRRVITPFDTVDPLARPPRLRLVRMRRWRRRCRELLAAHGPADTLRTARRARIDLLPHQLEPALAVVRGLGSRLLIADDVGLGKTIQAGLIVSELAARGAADRVLVLAPAGLREQWARELNDRFGIDAAVVDMREARRRASALPIGLNPWSTVPVAIASIDYVKRPEVLPAVLSCRWDVVIIDEAHGVGAGSDRSDAVSALCRFAPHVLLLTATPHSGDREAFLSLCRLGSHPGDRLLAFRRTRRDCALDTRRRVHRLSVRPSGDEIHMHAALTRFTQAVRAEHGDRDRDAWLSLTTLHKRALSSARSLEQSVLRRLAVLPSGSGRGQQIGLPFDDRDGELDASDEPPAWTGPSLADVECERQLLTAIADAARAAARRETKIAALARLLARLHRRAERAIVFTEYRDTLLHLRDSLPFACAILHGGLTREERRSALEEFTSGRRPILLATDAAGEGLNLHHDCRVVVNLELPWNPVRLEQRAGRVDRIGQRRTVHAFCLIGRDTSETRILQRLKRRVALAQRDIDTADPLGLNPAVEQDDEEIMSLLVVLGEPADLTAASFPPTTEARPPVEDGCVRIVRLRDDAAIEQARLVQARSFLGPNLQGTGAPAADDQLVALARRYDVRSALGSRLLVVVQSMFEDTAGRVVASHLTPLAINVSSRILRRALRGTVASLLRALQLPPMDTLDASQARWSADTTGHHHAFWKTRLVREHAIAAARRAGGTLLYQPGLYDRRAEREHQVGHDHRNDLADDALRHVAAAERAATIVAKDPGVVLILVP